MLEIEVEFLTRVSVAASPESRNQAEWPPHPDRLFQALVAAWGRNEPPREDERQALLWLETLERWRVSGPSGHRRDVATVFVPPNDARVAGHANDKASKSFADSLRLLPEFRKNRQPRFFPAVIPSSHRSVVRYLWGPADGFDSHRAALDRLARGVVYLGHSHSLVRVSVSEKLVGESEVVESSWTEGRDPQLRTPYPGRLAELERSYRLGPIVRPRPSTNRVRPLNSGDAPASETTVFDPQPLVVFADCGGLSPALEAFPLVARRMRDALMSVASAKGIEIGALLSGHEAAERPATEPHLAIVPLADVGWEWSSGRLMGLALVVPRGCAGADRMRLQHTIEAFSADPRLTFGAGAWRLEFADEARAASLRFSRLIGPRNGERRWCTVLPAVLDRHPKTKPGEDLAAIVVGACMRAGLPASAVDGLRVEVHKHAPLRGAPSAPQVVCALSENSPYRTRPIRHLVLTFATPIRGPLLIGAGRYRGLGFCLPMPFKRAGK